MVEVRKVFGITCKVDGENLYHKGPLSGFTPHREQAAFCETWADANKRMWEADAMLPAFLRGRCEICEIELRT